VDGGRCGRGQWSANICSACAKPNLATYSSVGPCVRDAVTMMYDDLLLSGLQKTRPTQALAPVGIFFIEETP
jgi:hypothetical protein